MESNCETKIDENEIEYPATEVYAHEVVQKEHLNTKSVYECRGVYKSKEEVARAFKVGDFDPAKTMYIAPDGKFYFLQWKEEPDQLDQFKQNQAKLEKMLREQANL